MTVKLAQIGDVATNSKPISPKSALHVLTLTPFFPSAEDEVRGCFIAESLAELRRHSIRSTVIAATPAHHPRKTPTTSSPAEWVRYPQIPGNLGLSSAGRFLSQRLLARVRDLHQKDRIDLIHAHAALPCGHAAMLLSRHLKIPYVVTLHGLDVFNTCFLAGRGAEWRRQVSVEVYREARKVICISGKVEQLLRTGLQGNVRSTVVYNGADTHRFSPADRPSSGNQEILIVGNLLRGKGHELVLRAMAGLRPTHPELRCRMIGEGPDRQRFQSLAQTLGIASQVEFAGARSRHEVADAMRACTIMALPSRYEGLGCVYLEAMACAKPVIACLGQGIEEIIKHGENGWLVPVDGLAELETGLRTLLDSPELCTRIATAARDTILKSLTLFHQAQQLAKVYAEATA